jgi:CBS domain-containing protein
MSVVSNVRSILKNKKIDAVFSINPEASVYVALELMALRNVGALLVMEGSRVLGIITERDYARKCILQKRSSKLTKVSEIMTVEPISVSPDDLVDQVMTTMTEERVRHLPVFENGSLLGVISIGDVVKAMMSDKEFLIHQLSSYITDSSHSAVQSKAPSTGFAADSKTARMRVAS